MDISTEITKSNLYKGRHLPGFVPIQLYPGKEQKHTAELNMRFCASVCYVNNKSQNGWSWQAPLEVIWPDSLLQEDCEEPAAQDCVQTAVEYLWGWRLHSLSSKPVVMPPVFSREEEITSLDLLATLLLMKPNIAFAFFAIWAYGWLLFSSVSRTFPAGWPSACTSTWGYSPPGAGLFSSCWTCEVPVSPFL